MFANDALLWVEQPLPPQFDFVFRTWEQEVKADPSLAGRQPYKALLVKDTAFLVGAATQDPKEVATMLKVLATALPADPQSVQR